MAVKFRLLLLLVLLDGTNVSAQVYFTKITTDLSRMSWVKIISVTETNPSVVECSIQCSSDGACFGFGYKTDTGGDSCVLLLPSPVNVKQFYAGYEYFISSNLSSCCGEFGQSRITPLLLKGGTPVVARCKTMADGTWLVFQRRYNGLENFNRTWSEYKDGFGDLQSEFWWGNEMLHLATSPVEGEFALDVYREKGKSLREQYFQFHIKSEEADYTILLDSIEADILSVDTVFHHGGLEFTTSNSGCKDAAGGWWTHFCEEGASLNGRFGGLAECNINPRPNKCWTSSEMMFARAILETFYMYGIPYQYIRPI